MPSPNPTTQRSVAEVLPNHAESAGADAPIFSQLADDADMAELVEMFVNELPNRVESLLSHWQNRDFRELRRLAHQIKGSSGGYGFSQLGRAAAQLEQELNTLIDQGQETEIERVSHEIDALVHLCGRVRAK